jgi:hypothetical protein
MKNTFTIYVSIFDRKSTPLLSLTKVSSSVARGAMIAFKEFYDSKYKFECKNDLTGEVVDSVGPRQIHTN